MTHRIGIDLGGTKISGVVLDADGHEVARARHPTPRDDYDGTLAAIAALVAELEANAGVEAGSTTVGIGTPGTWQPRLERMKNCNSTWLNDRPLLFDLERLLGPRVLIANDADCLGVSEATDGAGADAKSVFAVILGTGVGGALVVRGKLVQGPNGLAGEWGHMPLPYFRQRVWAVGTGVGGGVEPGVGPGVGADSRPRSGDRSRTPNSRSGDRSHDSEGRSHDSEDRSQTPESRTGVRSYTRNSRFGDRGHSEEAFQLESRLEDRACYCGRLNCVETFLSGPGLAATHAELWGEARSAKAVAGGQDEESRMTLNLYQHMLARSLAQVVNLVDPAVIVLGGGVSNMARLYAVQQSLIPAYVFSSVRGDGGRADESGRAGPDDGAGDVQVTVRRARWGDDSGVRGAARLWEVKV